MRGVIAGAKEKNMRCIHQEISKNQVGSIEYCSRQETYYLRTKKWSLHLEEGEFLALTRLFAGGLKVVYEKRKPEMRRGLELVR